jgi:hypothetical protein
VSTSKLLALIAACSLAAAGIAACGGGDDNEEGDDTASVSFASPQDGATEGDSVTATVDVESFEIDAADVGKMNVPGKGHLHFSLDGGKYDNSKYSGANGKLAEQLGTDGQYSPSTEPSITYRGLPPGQHTLEVDLVNNDHSETGVSDTITFTTQ